MNEFDNEEEYESKFSKIKCYNELMKINKEVEEEYEKAEKLREIILNYIEDYNFSGAQALENTAAPVLIVEKQTLYGPLKGLLIPKAKGKNGENLIFGVPKKGELPSGIYGNKLGDKGFTVKSRRKALLIALQKAMVLRALNNGGYANIDTKLSNIMISEEGVVAMIDIGSIVKHGEKIKVYTVFHFVMNFVKNLGQYNGFYKFKRKYLSHVNSKLCI